MFGFLFENDIKSLYFCIYPFESIVIARFHSKYSQAHMHVPRRHADLTVTTSTLPVQKTSFPVTITASVLVSSLGFVSGIEALKLAFLTRGTMLIY